MLRKNNVYAFILIILLFLSINILTYENIALGSDGDDNNGNNKNDDSDDNDDRKDKKDKNDDDKDDDPFILPLPFP